MNMNPQWTRALPGALVMLVFGGACQDTPVGPHAPRERAAPRPPLVQATVFSGRSADSLVESVALAWASHGHPEYRRSIRAWRQRMLGTNDPRKLRDAQIGKTLGWSADGEIEKESPKVLSHREALRFGYSSSGFSVPTVVEGEMTFVGDQGRISAVDFSFTSNTGGSYSVGGDLASGAGQIINCTDPVSGSCANSRRLSGAMRLSTMPVCNASASGNVNYQALNLPATFALPILTDFTVNSGETQTDVNNLGVHLTAVSRPCPTTGDDGTADPTGSGTDPEDPYSSEPWQPGSTWIDAPYEPPLDNPCETADFVYDGNDLVMAVRITCQET